MYNTTFNDPATFAAIVNKAVADLKDVQFRTIVFRGFSGALVGPAVAVQLGKPWALVRKKGDKCHSRKRTEGKV